MVNKEGVVTAVSEGNATITASVNGQSASCIVKVTAKTEEFSIGDTWTVPGQWRFRVDSVEKHYACNSVSKLTGEEVVIINYTYWNDGYENSIQNLFFNFLNFSVYDSTGLAAEDYPCTHEADGQTVIKGTHSSAGEAFILKNTGSPITLYVSHNTSTNGKYGENQSAIFKLDEIRDGLNKISLSETSVSLETGETKSLKVSYDPADYSGDKTVTWTSSDTSVASVNKEGVVTAVSEGNATITASVNGQSASCIVKVTAKTEEFSIGDTWTVPGQWRFRVDSVEKHYACNSVSKLTGEEVVIINYTYWNDGYEDNLGGGLYLNSVSFDLYDSKGVAAEVYPCAYHVTFPKNLIVGTSCSASEAYILKNAGRPLTLSVSHFTSTNGRASAIFKLN